MLARRPGHALSCTRAARPLLPECFEFDQCGKRFCLWPNAQQSIGASMLFANADDTILIVAAADTVVELEAFYRQCLDQPDPSIQSQSQPGTTDMLLDARFTGLRNPPYVFTFADVTTRQAFTEAQSIVTVTPADLRRRQQA